MKSCCGLVQDIEGLARITFTQFCCQLNTLTLTTRQSGTGLPQLDISQTYILQDLYLAEDSGDIFEKLYSLIDGHIQDIGNALTTITYLEGLAVISLSTTFLTRHKDIWKKIHLNGLIAIATTSLTTPTPDIE